MPIDNNEPSAVLPQPNAPTAPVIPAGYREDAAGNLVPESRIRDIDKVCDQLVMALCAKAEAQSAALHRFKLEAMTDVAAFVSMSLEEYGVNRGGEKGNVTLLSFDGRFKIIRHVQERITFGEQLMAAKALIDECVHTWAAGANDKIRALVSHAFQTDKEGKINTGRVLSLRRLDIRDDKWQRAMDAIADSMRTTHSKAYMRFYRRDDRTGDYVPISLDVARA